MNRLRLCRRSLLVCQYRHSSIVPSQQIPVVNEETSLVTTNSLYPPIKPKFPPGNWGGMDPSYAWLWQKSIDESLAISSAKERIAALCGKEYRRLIIKGRDRRPRTLDFKKFVTKTHIVSGSPDIYDTSLDGNQLDELTSVIAPHICDLIVMEMEQLKRSGLRKVKKVKIQDGFPYEERINCLLRGILTTLLTRLSVEFPHLQTVQYDEQATLSAIWERHGITRRRKRMVKPEFFKVDIVNDQGVSGSDTAEFVILSDKPLPEFLDQKESLSVGHEFPDLKYPPSVYGQSFQPQVKGSVIPGHKWGEPCEFGLLWVYNTVWAHDLEKDFGANHAQDAVLAQGITSSFISLAAQAHSQGFNTLLELTYPLTTQTILTDGARWQFLAYQLNTLQLWKDDQANPVNNVCWYTTPASLFHSVQDGKVVGFNPDVLRQIIAAVALAPADRPYDLRPLLPEEEEVQEPREYIPVKQEEVVVEEKVKYVLE